jgi:hypothetical protein
LFAGYEEDFSKGQNTVHLMRRAHLAFQQHNKAQYISVTRFVQYMGRQFITCKAVWLKTKCFANEFRKRFSDFCFINKTVLYGGKHSRPSYGSMTENWNCPTTPSKVCGSNISNFIQKP